MNGNIIKFFISFDRYNQCRVKNAIVLRNDGLAKISKIIRKSKKYMNENVFDFVFVSVGDTSALLTVSDSCGASVGKVRQISEKATCRRRHKINANNHF